MSVSSTSAELPDIQPDELPNPESTVEMRDTRSNVNPIPPVSEAITNSHPLKVSSRGRVIKAPKSLIENSEL